jgi:hypothetical protein
MLAVECGTATARTGRWACVVVRGSVFAFARTGSARSSTPANCRKSNHVLGDSRMIIASARRGQEAELV